MSAAELWFAGPPMLLLYVGLSVLAAFTVRGYAGFGSSLIGVSALSIVLPPAQVVPAIFALEILASIGLLPAVWRQVNWRSLAWIAGGCAAATPLGIALLLRLPVEAMRIGVSLVVIVAALVLLKGFRLSRAPGPGPTFGVGCLVGLLNGATGLGGPPAVVFYFSSDDGVAAGRATLIAFFLFTDLYALAFAGAGGLLDSGALALALYAVPFVIGGIWLGHRQFIGASPETFRRVVLWVLAGLGTAGLAAAAFRTVISA